MFSVGAMLFRLLAPRPPAPMMATFSRSFGPSRRGSSAWAAPGQKPRGAERTAVPARVVVVRNSRRLRRLMVEALLLMRHGRSLGSFRTILARLLAKRNRLLDVALFGKPDLRKPLNVALSNAEVPFFIARIR